MHVDRIRYGNAHDWIISHQHMARTGGILSWGRGSKAPNFCPNIRIQIVNCVIEEGVISQAICPLCV